jgi:L-amino acid N-acyltransferase
MITIRNASEDDLPAILAIANQVILTTTAVYDYVPHTLEMRQHWYRGKVAAGWPVFVADDSGEVVGFSSIGPFRQWPAYKYSVENSIYVASGRRGAGIGKLLLAQAIEAARAKEMHTDIAGIDADNHASRSLHRSFGFEEVAHFKQVGYKFGRWLDLVFLQLMLETPGRPVDG